VTRAIRLAIAACLVSWAAPALGQNTAVLPSTCNPNSGQCVTSIPVVNPDGTRIGAAGTAGAPSGNVQTVQGVDQGTPQNTQARGTGTLVTGQITVGTTATLIANARALRATIGVTVIGAVQCTFGNAGVTATTGWPLAAIAYATDTWATTAALYAVCASSTTVAYREQF